MMRVIQAFMPTLFSLVIAMGLYYFWLGDAGEYCGVKLHSKECYPCYLIGFEDCCTCTRLGGALLALSLAGVGLSDLRRLFSPRAGTQSKQEVSLKGFGAMEAAIVNAAMDWIKANYPTLLP